MFLNFFFHRGGLILVCFFAMTVSSSKSSASLFQKQVLATANKGHSLLKKVRFPISAAKAVVLFDVRTGRVLFKRNDTQHRQVASIQKLLTALIIAESGDLDKLVIIKHPD